MNTHSFDRRGISVLSLVTLPLLIVGVVSVVVEPAAAQRRKCDRPFAEAVAIFDVPGAEATPTSDGCWIFSLYLDHPTLPTGSGIAVLRRTESGVELHRAFPMSIPRPGGPRGPRVIGLAVTHDDKLLVVSHDRSLTFFDVGRMTSDAANPILGEIQSPRLAQSWGVVVSADDKYAFAAQRVTSSVVIVDLDKIRQGAFDQTAFAGVIPTAQGATMPLLSRDGRYLFAPTLQAPDVLDAPLNCGGGKGAEGSVQVVDVQRARTDPGSATLGFAFPAGCSPLWAALSPDGNRLSAASPGPISPSMTFSAADSSVTVFDARPLRDGKPPIRIGKVPVPAGPVRVLDNGDKLLVGFAGASEALVIDPSKAALGAAAVIGTLPISPAKLSSDGQTVLGGSGKGLTFVDLQRVKLGPTAK